MHVGAIYWPRPRPQPTWHCKDCGAPQYDDKSWAICSKGRCLKCYDKSEEGKALQAHIDAEFEKVMASG